MSPTMETTTDVPTPTRSLAQRREALEQANKIRSYRANLKRDMKAGRKDIIDVIRRPPEEVATMKLAELLLAVPKLGRTKVGTMLNKTRISPSKTIEGLTHRQRDEILHHLGRRP